MSRKLTLNELISLTFDANPEVRRQAALELSHYDDPGANFAILELTYDKDTNVSWTAREILDKRKASQPQLMSFAEVFGKGEEKKKEEKPQTAEETRKAETVREKMLKPLHQLMEKKLGKEKAEAMKSKMMPTLEKIYLKAVGKNGQVNEEKGKAVQEMLTDYLDVISGAETHVISDEGEEKGQKPTVPEKKGREEDAAEPEDAPPESEPGSGIELERVGTKEPEMGRAARELEEAAAESELEALEPQELREEKEEAGGAGTMFRLAFDTMMASDGDEDVMKKAMENMVRNADEEIKLAFRVAKEKYKQLNITHLTELKSGMKRVNTVPLLVKTIEHREWQRTKKTRDTFTRLLVADEEGNEGVIYLFDN
ncbi:MAG: hypothetical protein NTY83_02350, partial [Candidatus Micrarchaeota archaeon]|nr:hypothetical protein [Candidatus Micrarchaeota archaeon]